MTLHDDELPVDLALVRRLLAGTPYADLPVRPLPSTGSSNALFRLGDDLLLRLPRQPGGSASIAKEARWLPTLDLPTATPRIEYVAGSGAGFSEGWSIVRWIDGTHPGAGTGGTALARDLAGVVRALRAAPVPPDALADPALRWYRAEPLAGIDRDVQEAVAACRDLPGLNLDLDAVTRLWAAARDRPGVDLPSWLHADLVAENLLVAGDRLGAVLDFGALCVGDPTADLVVAWELLGSAGRAAFRDALEVDDDTWLRGRAWAVAIAVITLPYYWRTMPARCRDRLVMARAALAG